MLVARVIGRNEDGTRVSAAEGRIPVNNFMSILRLVAAQRLTRIQARDMLQEITRNSVAPTAAERNEALAMVDSILAQTTPVARMQRASEIGDTLTLGAAGVSMFRLPSQVNAFLGL